MEEYVLSDRAFGRGDANRRSLEHLLQLLRKNHGLSIFCSLKTHRDLRVI